MTPVRRFYGPPSFLALWAAQITALLGTRLSRFAILWWLSQQPSAAASVTAAVWFALLPTIVLGPFVGVLVDRFARKRVMLVAEGLRAVAVGLLAAAAMGTELLPLGAVFIFLFVSELAAVVLDAAFNATMPLMLEDRTLLRVQGLSQTFYHGIDLLAAPLGVLLLSSLGFSGVLGTHLALSLAAFITLGWVRIPSPAPSSEMMSWGAFWRTFASGVAAMWRYRSVFILVLLLGGANFFTVPVTSLKVLLVSEHFKGSALQFSQMEVAAGAGVLLGGVVLSLWGGTRQHSLTFLMALAGVGASILFAGLLPPSAFVGALVAVFVAGFCVPLMLASFLTLLQLTVPPALLGRIFTLVSMMALLPAVLGLPLLGSLAEGLGVIFVYRLAGLALLTLAGLGLIYVWWRAAGVSKT